MITIIAPYTDHTPHNQHPTTGGDSGIHLWEYKRIWYHTRPYLKTLTCYTQLSNHDSRHDDDEHQLRGGFGPTWSRIRCLSRFPVQDAQSTAAPWHDKRGHHQCLQENPEYSPSKPHVKPQWQCRQQQEQHQQKRLGYQLQSLESLPCPSWQLFGPIRKRDWLAPIVDRTTEEAPRQLYARTRNGRWPQGVGLWLYSESERSFDSIHQ